MQIESGKLIATAEYECQHLEKQSYAWIACGTQEKGNEGGHKIASFLLKQGECSARSGWYDRAFCNLVQ